MAGDGATWVAVRDDGAAMPPAERDSIFAPYYRVQRRSGLVASVGLGLTVSRELARMMDGDVTYDYDGAHNVFALRLPWATGRATPAPSAMRSGPEARPW